jgi:hypothetical protein
MFAVLTTAAKQQGFFAHLQASLWHRNRGGSIQDAERRLNSTTASTSGRAPSPVPAESPVRIHTQWQGMDQGSDR